MREHIDPTEKGRAWVMSRWFVVPAAPEDLVDKWILQCPSCSSYFAVKLEDRLRGDIPDRCPICGFSGEA